MSDQPPDDSSFIFSNIRYDSSAKTSGTSEQLLDISKNQANIEKDKTEPLSSAQIKDVKVEIPQAMTGAPYALQGYYDTSYRPEELAQAQTQAPGSVVNASPIDFTQSQQAYQYRLQHSYDQQFSQSTGGYPPYSPVAVPSFPGYAQQTLQQQQQQQQQLLLLQQPQQQPQQQQQTSIPIGPDYSEQPYNQGFFPYQQLLQPSFAYNQPQHSDPSQLTAGSRPPGSQIIGADNMPQPYHQSLSSAVSSNTYTSSSGLQQQPSYQYQLGLHSQSSPPQPVPRQSTHNPNASPAESAGNKGPPREFDQQQVPPSKHVPPQQQPRQQSQGNTSNQDAFSYVSRYASKEPVASMSSSSRAQQKARQRRRTGSKRSLEDMVLDSFVPTYVPVMGSTSTSRQSYVGLLTSSFDSGDHSSLSPIDAGTENVLPLTLPEPPLRTAVPLNPQALSKSKTVKPKKRSKYTPEQDMIILQWKREGKSWSEIAAAANCGKSLAARNRYQVLIGQQGGNTFVWDTEDSAALKELLDEGEKAKWDFIASEFSRMKLQRVSADACRRKIKELFDQDPSAFGVVLQQLPPGNLEGNVSSAKNTDNLPVQFPSSIPEYEAENFELPPRS